MKRIFELARDQRAKVSFIREIFSPEYIRKDFSAVLKVYERVRYAVWFMLSLAIIVFIVWTACVGFNLFQAISLVRGAS